MVIFARAGRAYVNTPALVPTTAHGPAPESAHIKNLHGPAPVPVYCAHIQYKIHVPL